MQQTIDLLAVGYNTDSSGTPVATLAARTTVLCNFKSVSMREVYQAMSVKRAPEIVAVLSDYLDYSGEQFAVYAGKVYRVLRTYVPDRSIELTLERTRELEGVI